MAIIRKELEVKRSSLDQYDVFDCVIEETSDLQDDEFNYVGTGSMVLCIADSKVYCKKADGTWAEVSI